MRTPRLPSAARRPWAALAALAAALAAAPLAAQSAPAVLTGTVRGTDGVGLSNARIGIDGRGRNAQTERAGHFRVEGLAAGSHTVDVRAIGYRQQRLEVTLVPGEEHRLAVVLEIEPVALPAVQADGIAEAPLQLQGFYQRRSRGAGHFFTREQIERMQPRQFTDVLRRVPGVQVLNGSGPYGAAQMVQVGRTAGPRSCTVQFYVNGMPFPVTADVGINTFIRPEDVAALEVYSGTSRIPPQFNSSIHNSRCGVVAIWTRSADG